LAKRKIRNNLKRGIQKAKRGSKPVMFGALPLFIVFFVFVLFYLVGGGFYAEPSPELLGLLIVAASFTFPLMINVLMNNRVEKKDIYVGLIVGALGVAIIFGALGLSTGQNSVIAGIMLSSIGTLGFIMVLIAFGALAMYYFGSRPKVK